MKKDIYIIKNKINDKVYIGQSINPAERWIKHVDKALHNPNYQIITKAMNKYGIDNFWYEILEHQVENYDEREQYWIQQYNSLIPNGYNVAMGGNSSGAGINSPSAAIKSQDVLDEIIELLLKNEISMHQIAVMYNVCDEVIQSINNGKRYVQQNLTYPLRPSNRYSDDLLKQLAYALKYETDKTLEDIAKEYNIDRSELSAFNNGKVHRVDWLEYPIRKGRMGTKTADIHKEIKKMLKETTIPQKDIAKKFNIAITAVSNINLGKTYRENDIDYPIRQNYQGNRTTTKFFPPDLLKQICNDLQNSTLSMRDIAEKYETTITTIMNINTGSIKKYRRDDIKYPLRKK